MSTSSFKGENFKAYYTQMSYNWPGPLNTVVNSNSATLKWGDSFTGVPNPSWKSQVRDGQSATTPASGVKSTVSFPYLSSVLEMSLGTMEQHNYLYRFNSFIGAPVGLMPTVLPVDNVDTASLNQVLARVDSDFLDKAKSAISSFQSGQDIVEIHQTIESIIHPLKSLREHVASYFTNLKKVSNRISKQRGSPSKKKTSLKKALADTYLEWTFGWNPLASDIASGIVDLTHHRAAIVQIESFAKVRYHGIDGTYGADPTLTNSVAAHQINTSEYSIRLKGAVDAYYNNTPPSLLQELQLLPEDFAPTAWNVLPYSFVVDYFLNIGDIINAYSFPTAALRWVNRSDRQVSRCQIGYYFDKALIKQNTDAGWKVLNQELSSANFDATVTLFTRSSISASDLVPPLVIHIPKPSAKPWLNIAALLAGSQRLVTPFY